MGPELLKGLLFCWAWYFMRGGPAFAHEEFSYTTQGCCCLGETPAKHAAIFIRGQPSLGRQANQPAKPANAPEDGGADGSTGAGPGVFKSNK